MTQKEKHEIIKGLLKAAKAQFDLIANELKDAEKSFEDKDSQFNNFHLLLGTVDVIPVRLDSMQNTIRAMRMLAIEYSKDK